MRKILFFFSLMFFSFAVHGQFVGLVINEFSQGAFGNEEYIEFLVVGKRTCTQTTADLRGWIFDDQNGWYGAGANSSSAPGHYRFSNNPTWSAVPFGSIIVVYNPDERNNSLPLDLIDPTNFKYIVPIDGTNQGVLFQQENTPYPFSQPNGTTTQRTYVYPGPTNTTNYSAAAKTSWVNTIAINNSSMNTPGDVLNTISPSDRANAFFSIAHKYPTSPPYRSPLVSIAVVPGGNVAFLQDANYALSTSWGISAVAGNETPGVPNTFANATWINLMRVNPIPPLVSVNAPKICQGINTTVTATPNPSPGSYQYSWIVPTGLNNPGNVQSFTTNVAGNYTVTITDALNCTATGFGDVTLNPTPAAPTASVTQQPTCTTPTGTIVITAPLGTGFTYSLDGINYQTSPTFSGRTPATYSVTVKNTLGCISTGTSVTVNAIPSAPNSPTASVTQPTCTTPTGIIVVSPTTGFTYSIDGINYQTSSTFSGLAPSTYNVTVKNTSGCISPATTLIVDAAPLTPAAPTASVTQQPSCTTPTGTVVITSPTGTGFTYSIDGSNYQTGTTFTGLTTTTYNVTVKNTAGCISAAASLIINAVPSTPAAPTASVTQPTCTTPTGIIVVSPTTGVTYSIDGINYQTSTTFTGLAPATYSVIVKNTSGCISAATSLIINAAPSTPNAPTASVTQQPTCTTPTGIIVVSATTGFTYSIDGTNYQTSPTFSGLAPATYNVTVKNTSGCVSPATSLIINTAPSIPAAPTASVTQQPTCTTPTGTIVITAPTGTGFTYSIDGINYQTSSTFTGLTPATYSVTVKNPAGCISTATTLIVDAAPSTPIAPTASVTQQPSCTTPTGTILVSATTGFTYSIDGINYQTSSTFSGLAPATYNVTVKNTSGCISPATSLIINTAPSIPAAATASATQPTCTTSTGTIIITAPTGTGFTYSIDGINYQTSTTFSGLTPATYSVTVKNTAGCISTATSVTVNSIPSTPNSPTASATQQPTCTTPAGTITITAPTGTGFTYSIEGINYQTSPTFSGLTPSTYSVTVKNTAGCISAATSLIINAVPFTPAAPTASVTQPTCTTPTGTILVSATTGFTYSIDGINYQTSPTFSGLAPATYNLTIKNTAGCISPATSLIINAVPSTPAAPTASVTQQPTCITPTGTITITAPTGTGFTYSIDGINYPTSSTFSGLTQSTYNVSVKNTSGCISAATSLIINAAPSTPAAPSASVTQPTCTTPTGTIVVSATTGFTYSIDGSNYQTSPTFTGLTPATYSVTAKNTAGCISGATSLIVNAVPSTPAAPTASVTQQPTCSTPTGTIVITAQTGTGFTYSIDGINYQTSSTFTGLAPATYNVTVKNTAECISAATSLIINAVPSTPAAPTASVTQPTCTTPTGTILVSATTGFTYSVDGINYQTSTTFSGLTPATYNVTVKNTAGCISAATSLIVDAPPSTPAAPTASVTQQPICTIPTGTIVITAPTGTGFTYSIEGINYQTSPTFSGLTPSTYSVTVKNTAGCISAATSLIINAVPFTPAAPTASVTQPTCTTPTGTILVSATTGFTYSIDGINYQTSPTFSGLAPATYNLTIKNTAGCISPATSLIINAVPSTPAAPTASVTQQPTCITPTGTITITAPTGTGFTYSIDGINYPTSSTFSGLTPSTYNVSVKNTSGCISAATSLIINAAPSTPAAPSASVTQPTCTTPTGTIVVSATTGFTYSIDGSNYQTSPTFTGLTPATYSVTAKNTAGCISTATSLVINAAPTSPAAPRASVTQPACTTPTGTIVITVPTGTGFTYSIDGTNYQTGPTFSGLAPATYSVTVKNTAGCISTATSLIIDAVPSIPAAPTASATQPTCTAPTGIIVITTPTGTGFTYSIDGINYQTSTTFSGLAPAIYHVTVKNTSGCISTGTSVTVNAIPSTPNSPTISVTQPTCTTPTGIIVVSATTGFTYSIDGINYQTSPTFTGLAPSTYNITVKNNSGCISAATTVTVNQLNSTVTITTSTVEEACGKNNGSITAIGTGGTTPYLFSLNNGVFVQNNIFNSLSAGSYDITIKDAGGCTNNITVVVKQTSNAVTTSSIIAGCKSVLFRGVTYTNSTIIKDTLKTTAGCDSVYRVTNITVQNTPTVTNSITLRGCDSVVYNSATYKTSAALRDTMRTTAGCDSIYSITNIEVVHFNLSLLANPNPAFARTTVILSTSANIPYQTVSWQPAYLFPLQKASTQRITADSSRIIKVTAESTAGCIDSAQLYIEVKEFNDFFIPNSFSPNADGKNDQFVAMGTTIGKGKMRIFNQWGELIFSTDDITKGWDGYSKGIIQPIGVYVYEIQVTMLNGSEIKRKGFVNLIR